MARRVIFISLLFLSLISPSLTIRGVPPHESGKYASETYTCGDVVIPRTSINDDYCDCTDGSDEPGTSACPNGSFYCQNKGFKPQNLASWAVNDGICDCCDGTDEWRKGGTKCVNNCQEMGKELRRGTEEQIEKVKKGLEKRKEMLEKAETLYNQKKNEIRVSQQEMDSIKESLRAADEAKQDAKRIEDDARERRQKLEDEEKSVAKQKWEEAQAAAASQEPVIAVEAPGSDPHATGEPAQDIIHEDDEEEEEEEPEIDEALDEREKEKLRKKRDRERRARERRREQKRKEREQKEQNPDFPFEPSAELTALQDNENKAREIHDNARSEWQQIEDRNQRAKDIFEKAKQLLDSDLGENNQWLALHDTHFELHTDQYQYNFAPFGDAKQGHTSLGEWKGFKNDGKVMAFEGGQKCWDGPERSLKVYLICGDQEEILAVTEPNKCEYEAKFTTPLACTEAELNELHAALKQYQ